MAFLPPVAPVWASRRITRSPAISMRASVKTRPRPVVKSSRVRNPRSRSSSSRVAERTVVPSTAPSSSPPDQVTYPSMPIAVPAIVGTKPADLASSDGLEFFAQEIRRYSLLSAVEERDLASQIRAVQPLLRIRENMTVESGKEPTLVEWARQVDMDVEELSHLIDAGATAKETLVNANLRLVVHIAKRFHKSRGDLGVPLLDLIQEGSLSLIRVAELFDPDRGFRFASYAWPAVVSRIRRAANNPPGAVVRVPERLRRAARKLRAFRQKTLQETGSLPTAAQEAALIPPTSLALVKSATPHFQNTLLLDQPLVAENGTTTLMDTVASHAQQPEDIVNYSILSCKVRDSIQKHLTPRSADILVAKFGLDGDAPMKSTEIAERYGISGPRVHQLINNGLAKLRKKDPELETLLKFYS